MAPARCWHVEVARQAHDAMGAACGSAWRGMSPESDVLLLAPRPRHGFSARHRCMDSRVGDRPLRGRVTNLRPGAASVRRARTLCSALSLDEHGRTRSLSRISPVGIWRGSARSLVKPVQRFGRPSSRGQFQGLLRFVGTRRDGFGEVDTSPTGREAPLIRGLPPHLTRQIETQSPCLASPKLGHELGEGSSVKRKSAYATEIRSAPDCNFDVELVPGSHATFDF